MTSPSDLPPILKDKDRPGPPPLLTEKQLRPGPGLAIFVGAFAIISFGAIVWFSAEKGTIIGGVDELPLVTSNNAPVRIKPTEPGGMKVPHQDKLILKELVEEEIEDKEVMEHLLPRAELPIAIQSSKEPDSNAKEIREKSPTTNSTESSDKLFSKSEIKEKRITSKDKKVKSKTILAHKGIESGQYKIQLASVRSEKAAQAIWKKYTEKHKSLLNKLKPVIEKVNIKGKGVFFRVQGGMLEKKSARKVCLALLRKKQACIITMKK